MAAEQFQTFCEHLNCAKNGCGKARSIAKQYPDGALAREHPLAARLDYIEREAAVAVGFDWQCQEPGKVLETIRDKVGIDTVPQQIIDTLSPARETTPITLVPTKIKSPRRVPRQKAS